MSLKIFLSKLNLSDESIKIYLEALPYSFLTYYELRSIMPEISDEQFSKYLDELTDVDLIIKREDEDINLGTQYLAIPPFSLILSYFNNIEKSFNQIQNQIDKLIKNSLDITFEQNTKINLKDLEQEIKTIFKDFEETTLLERKDAEDISKSFEAINKIKPQIDNLRQNINNIIKNQFSSLITFFSDLRNKIIERIENIEMKKNKDKELVITTIESVFKTELEEVINNFLISITDLIKEEFDKFSLDPYINTIIQNKNDFKTILLELIYNFEKKLNDISNSVKEKNENLNPNLKNLQKTIYEKVANVVNSSIDQISNLNKPIINVLSDFMESIYKQETLKTKEIWIIHSATRINEEIIAAVQNSEDQLFIMVPKLKDFLPIEIFSDTSKDLKIRLISSDPHVNSKVRQFKQINGLEFRNLENEQFIGVGFDKKFIALGILKHEIEDELKNFIGFGSNNQKIIDKIYKAFNNLWNLAEGELGKTEVEEKEIIFPKKEPQPQVKKSKMPKEKKIKIPTPVNEGELTEVGILINNTFNDLIKKLTDFTGIEFAKKLDKIADLVLEKRGFSVTLHHLREFIDRYEKQKAKLNQQDIDEIIENIEIWKKKLI